MDTLTLLHQVLYILRFPLSTCLATIILLFNRTLYPTLLYPYTIPISVFLSHLELLFCSGFLTKTLLP